MQNPALGLANGAVQVIDKNHSGGYLQNPGICFRNPASGEGPFGDKISELQEAQVGPGLARQGFSRPPLFRGGRASGMPPGAFAEVGRRPSTCLGRGRANPSQARIFPTSAIFQRSVNFLPSINLPDLLMAPVRQDSGIWTITIPYPAIQIFHFPTKNGRP